jgi:hypothetical protein
MAATANLPTSKELPSPKDPVFSEDEVRDLVTKAVNLARRTTPGNMSDEACIQRTMEDRYIEGRWRSILKQSPAK